MTRHTLARWALRAAWTVWVAAWMTASLGVQAAEPTAHPGQPALAAPARTAWRSDTGLPDRSHMIRATAAVVLTLAAATVWLASRKRRGRTAGSGWARLSRLRAGANDRPGDQAVVRQSMRLGGAATLHVVGWNGREWLIGCSAAGLTVVAEQSERPDRETALPSGGQR
jgi:hypothetical protein